MSGNQHHQESTDEVVNVKIGDVGLHLEDKNLSYSKDGNEGDKDRLYAEIIGICEVK